MSKGFIKIISQLLTIMRYVTVYTDIVILGHEKSGGKGAIMMAKQPSWELFRIEVILNHLIIEVTSEYHDLTLSIEIKTKKRHTVLCSDTRILGKPVSPK